MESEDHSMSTMVNVMCSMLESIWFYCQSVADVFLCCSQMMSRISTVVCWKRNGHLLLGYRKK